MPIAVACACGNLFRVKDELAGKRVRCPACQGTVNVGAATEPAPAAPSPASVRTGRPAPAPVPAEEDDYAEEAPRKKRRGQKKSSAVLLWSLVGGGVALIAAAVVVVLILVLGGSSPERQLVGTWKIDLEETKKVNQAVALGGALMNPFVIDFRDDGTGTLTIGAKSDSGKWKVTNVKDNKLMVDLTH